MSKVLVTGGMGFCGFNLAIHLSNHHKVIVMDNLVRRGSELNIPKIKDYNIQFIHGDIRNIEDFNHLPNGIDIILETAAQPAACTGYGNPTFDITNNYLGLLNVLEYARQYKCKLIFWSTNKVYDGDKINALPLKEMPTRYKLLNAKSIIDEEFSVDGGNHSIYGLSKICADLTCQEWAKAFEMPIIINRFSCLAGPNQWGKAEQGWVSWFCIAAILGLPITLYGWKGKQVRDVLFMPDICSLIDIEIKNIHKYRGEVFNIGGGVFCNTSLLECIGLIEKLTDKKIKWAYDKTQRKADQCFYISNTYKATQKLGWRPKVGMTDGLISIIDWVQKNEDELRGLYV